MESRDIQIMSGKRKPIASRCKDMDIQQASDQVDAVLDEVQQAVIADRDFLELILTGVLARGHVLLEDVPGTGKTLAANSVATALGLEFSRVQFTPDLLPTDITGTHVFNERDRSFQFNEGPLFANIVLADEINRAPPKTQAALLEAMEEQQVTVGDETYELPRPFFVIATQNPVEQEGTFELPEAQVDRFQIKSSIGYPDRSGEIELLRRRNTRDTQTPSVSPVLDTEQVQQLRNVPEEIHVDEDLLEYIATIGRKTRQRPRVDTGVSPRGVQRLFEAARARAVIDGRSYLLPDDIKSIAVPALAHRLVLTPQAQVNETDKTTIIEEVLDRVAVPTVEEPATTQ